MTRYLLLLIIIVQLWGCTETKPPKTLNASTIEVYYDNSWTLMGTTNINKNGIVRFAKCDIKDLYQKLRFYRDTLNTIEIDSLNKYLDSIRSEKIDTTYFYSCHDCGFIILRITYPDTIINTRINGRYKFTNNVAKLARFVLNNPPIEEYILDSTFNFELKRFLRTVPPPPGLN